MKTEKIDDLKSIRRGDLILHETGKLFTCIGRESNGWPILVREVVPDNPAEWAKVVEP